MKRTLRGVIAALVMVVPVVVVTESPASADTCCVYYSMLKSVGTGWAGGDYGWDVGNSFIFWTANSGTNRATKELGTQLNLARVAGYNGPSWARTACVRAIGNGSGTQWADGYCAAY